MGGALEISGEPSGNPVGLKLRGRRDGDAILNDIDRGIAEPHVKGVVAKCRREVVGKGCCVGRRHVHATPQGEVIVADHPPTLIRPAIS
jgi:hypothetical protein